MLDKEIAEKIALSVSENGGRTYYVGGYVRDELLGKPNKDIDIEVHGITVDKLEEILDAIGTRMEFGKSFGVYNLKGYGIDVALPRKEELTGIKHTDFRIDIDPFIGTKKAAERRDFTINALMKDVLTGEVIDHYNGIEDLNNKIIRHINPDKFIEDPLRVLRGAQFAARFNFTIAEETIALCKTIDLTNLSRERIMEELNKALMKAEKPSIFFEELNKMNGLDYWFKELKALKGIPQNPKYHAEGDVFVHTMMVVDEATKLKENVKYEEGFMLSAVCHDYGKAICTSEINGQIHSYNHEIEGLRLVEAFMNRITKDCYLTKYVLNMTRNHMRPLTLASDNASVKATNKMFDASIEPNDLIYLGVADGNGRIKDDGQIDRLPFLLERFEKFKEVMDRPYVRGEDLIKAGLKPDKSFSEILAYAHKLRLSGVDKENALKQTLNYAKGMKN